MLSTYEQPLKIPFIASLFMASNNDKPILTEDLLKRLAADLQDHLQHGAWREVKLGLRLLAILQDLLEGEGVFALLQELFDRAVDLQTSSSEDVCYPLQVNLRSLTLIGTWVGIGQDYPTNNRLCHGIVCEHSGLTGFGPFGENGYHCLSNPRA